MKKKRVVAAILAGILLVIGAVSCSPAPEELSPTKASEKTDAFLLETGMPQEAVDRMDADFKQRIYDNSNGDKLKFVGLQFQGEEGSHLLDDKNTIPKDDLIASVAVFSDGREGKDAVYTVYPMFEWKKAANIEMDGFLFFTSGRGDWELIPQKRNLWLYEGKDGTWQSCGVADVFSIVIENNGYGNNGLDSFCKGENYYKGIGYMQLKKCTDDAEVRCVIGYGRGGKSANQRVFMEAECKSDSINFTVSNKPVENRRVAFNF